MPPPPQLLEIIAANVTFELPFFFMLCSPPCFHYDILIVAYEWPHNVITCVNVLPATLSLLIG